MTEDERFAAVMAAEVANARLSPYMDKALRAVQKQPGAQSVPGVEIQGLLLREIDALRAELESPERDDGCGSPHSKGGKCAYDD